MGRCRRERERLHCLSAMLASSAGCQIVGVPCTGKEPVRLPLVGAEKMSRMLEQMVWTALVVRVGSTDKRLW